MPRRVRGRWTRSDRWTRMDRWSPTGHSRHPRTDPGDHSCRHQGLTRRPGGRPGGRGARRHGGHRRGGDRHHPLRVAPGPDGVAEQGGADGHRLDPRREDRRPPHVDADARCRARARSRPPVTVPSTSPPTPHSCTIGYHGQPGLDGLPITSATSVGPSTCRCRRSATVVPGKSWIAAPARWIVGGPGQLQSGGHVPDPPGRRATSSPRSARVWSTGSATQRLPRGHLPRPASSAPSTKDEGAGRAWPPRRSRGCSAPVGLSMDVYVGDADQMLRPRGHRHAHDGGRANG